MSDPDRIVPAGEIARTDAMALRQLEPFTVDPTIGPGGIPIPQELRLMAGVYKLNMFGLLPIAFRVTEEMPGDWFAQRQGEIIRLLQEPVIRLVNPGDALQWRPLFDFEPFPSLNIVCLSRPRTFGG